MSLEDEARSGRPTDATNKEKNSQSGIQVEEIAHASGISHGSVSTILHDGLGMHMLTACWIPKSLSDEQMGTRASVEAF